MSYYDWKIDKDKAEQYSGLTIHWYYPRTGNVWTEPKVETLDEDRKEAHTLMQGGIVKQADGSFNTGRVQSHLKTVFGDNAMLVGIHASTPDMLNGYRCEDIAFGWVNTMPAHEATLGVA